MQAQEYLDIIARWKKTYQISEERDYVLDELSKEDMVELERLDKQGLVWTQHSTCENEQISFGMHTFGGSGCGCWQTYCFYVGQTKGEEQFIDVTAYEPCPVCNAGGEGDGDPDCEGPEVPEGAETSEGCEEGWVQWYFD